MQIKKLFQKEPVNIKFKVYSFRRYGQPKLPKPTELKGIKQLLSVDYIINKCRCQVFIKDNDIWVKHRDYFSPSFIPPVEDIGKPLDYILEKYFNMGMKKKIVYSDNWSDVVLRSEAWIVVENLIAVIKNNIFELDILKEIVRQQEKIHGFKKYDLCCTDMERFWEKVIREVRTRI